VSEIAPEPVRTCPKRKKTTSGSFGHKTGICPNPVRSLSIENQPLTSFVRSVRSVRTLF